MKLIDKLCVVCSGKLQIHQDYVYDEGTNMEGNVTRSTFGERVDDRVSCSNCHLLYHIDILKDNT